MSRGSATAALVGGLIVGLGMGLALFWESPRSSEGVAVAASTATPPAPPLLSGAAAAPIIGAQAPDFTLMDVEGRAVQLSAQRGRAVVLNFWATWCEPCRLEMPLLQETYQERGPDRMLVLGVNLDEPLETVAAFRDELDLTFPLLLDPDGEVQRLYRVFGYPTTFVIDSDGVVRAIEIGVLDELRLARALKAAGLERE